jgi:hypothetical protein
METKLITPQEADDIIAGWDKAGVTVGLVDYRNAAFMAQHLGKIRTTARPGVHLHTAGSTTSFVNISRWREIVLAEDEEILGIRFRKPEGAQNLEMEIAVFISKSGELDKGYRFAGFAPDSLTPCQSIKLLHDQVAESERLHHPTKLFWLSRKKGEQPFQAVFVHENEIAD